MLFRIGEFHTPISISTLNEIVVEKIVFTVNKKYAFIAPPAIVFISI